jgi:glycosyltransferase involved in cell wall biosynthesis
MKIALLTTDSREFLKAYGNPVPQFGTAPEALLQGFSLLPDAEVHIVSCARAKMNSPEKLAPNIFFHSLCVPKIGWMRTAYQGCIRAVRKKLKEIRPDIVHGQGTERDCAINAVFSNFPNVVTIHGNMAELARQFRERVGSYVWLAGRLETFTLKRTDGVLCNSAYTEQLVKPRARRTWRVVNPIREQFFVPPAEPTLAQKCRLVNVGLVCRRKRQVELLDVARALREQGLDFEFQFIGQANPSDPYAAAFLEKIRPMEKEGFAHYAGLKRTHELIQAFDASSALVHFPFEEAFGLVAAEGLARNLKFFGARLGGLMDIASDVPDAELFPLDDWQGLTSAIARWIRRGYPPATGAASIMRARYHPENIAQQHLEIYREVLAGMVTVKPRKP